MKLLLYSDEFLYQKLYDYYSIIDENNEIIGSEFDRNSYDIFHINNPKYINYAINRLDGFQNVTDIIIQKSLFKNPVLMRILFKLKYFNPDAKVILYMDDDPIYYEVLLSRIAKYHLCNIATSFDELDKILSNDYDQNLDSYILKKETKSLLKEFKEY